ncbi:MAG: hypothetical protein QOI41_2432 [Myxococcales bacterium]|jgi:hypothetical protein|nr:hypothetical protein [Myxococcales bacterium]
MSLRSARFAPVAFLSFLAATALACSTSSDQVDDTAGDEAPITSNDAQIVDFTFSSEVIAPKSDDTRKAIVSQLLYTVGALTSEHQANGQIGRVQTSAITETVQGDNKRIKYTARLPVAWPKGQSVPKTYAVVLPNDTTKLAAFNDKYDGKCGSNEYGHEVFWHDFNPIATGCTVDTADVVKSNAKVTKNKAVTTGKYPEYAKVWEDGALNVVAIFGYSDSGGASDQGEQEYDSFVAKAKDLFPGATSTTNATTDSIHRDITVKAKVKVAGVDRDVSITSLLIGTLYTSGADFDTRYNPLSEKADLVVYNGHSELSKNTNALAAKGKVAPKQYQMFFFDSCDTYAYLDTALTDRRRAVNGAAADPAGTKYLDVATNVLPSYFSNYAASSLTFVSALANRDTPKTYNQIMSDLPSDQVVVVTGEEDNAFRP